MTARRRVLGLAIAAAPLAGAAAPRVSHAQVVAAGTRDVRDSLDASLVELRVGHLASRTVEAFRSGDAALLPVGALLELAEVRYQVGVDGAVTAVLQPGDVAIRVDTLAPFVVAGGRRVPIRRAQRVARDGELYVDAAVLAQVLGVEIAVSWPDLSVVVTNPESLPLGRRVAREAAREQLLQRRARLAAPDVTLGLARPAADGMIFDYSLSTPQAQPLKRGDYSLAAGADVFGGSLAAARASVGGMSSGETRDEASWTGVWHDGVLVKQLRVGDGVGTGPRLRPMRGLSVTNAPYLRASSFGMSAYDGRLAPGWMVEAYRGGQLVAFDTVATDGGYTVKLPVQYGENPVELVAYGPFGETREFNRNYRVLSDLVPARHVEYGLSGGRCTTALCDRTANADLRYGLTSRVTVRSGAERFWGRDSAGVASPSALLPYIGAQASLENGVGFTADRVWNGFDRMGASYEPSQRLRLLAEYTNFAAGAVPAPVAPLGRRSQLLLGSVLRPMATRAWFVVEGNADRVVSDVGTLSHARIGTAAELRGVRLLPYVRAERDESLTGERDTRTFAGANAFVIPRGDALRYMHGALVRLSAETQAGAGLSTASASLTRSLRSGMRVDVGGAWSRQAHGSLLTLVLSHDLSRFRSYSTVSAVPGEGTAASQLTQGSVVWNRGERRASLVPGPSLERAGVAGRVYLDANANGRFDDGDTPLPDVYVRVGSSGAPSDSTGRYRVWDVVPFEPLLVTVDSASLPSPLWVPSAATVSLQPGPNRYRSLDVPIVPGGVVEGRVVLRSDAGARALPGLDVFLRDRRTGLRRPAPTFADGEFSTYAVPPGDYDLVADAGALARLGASAEPVHVTVRAVADGDRVGGVELVVTRASGSEGERPVAPAVAMPSAPTTDTVGDGAKARSAAVAVEKSRTVPRHASPPGPALFEVNSASLTAAGRLSLDLAADEARADTAALDVVGRADPRGSREYNRVLARRRADAARDYLVSRGVAPSRLHVVSLGKDRPLPGTGAAWLAANRRVDVVRRTAIAGDASSPGTERARRLP